MSLLTLLIVCWTGILTQAPAATAPTDMPRFEVRLVADRSDADAEALETTDANEPTLQVERRVLLDASHVRAAQAQQAEHNPNEWSVLLTFTAAGSATFERVTGENMSRRLAIVLDGKVLSAPTIRSRIRGAAVISGSMN